MTKIFAYGTLLAGQPNHRVLRGSRCLGPARTPPRFTLLDLGPFPGLVADGKHVVHGEIYEVDDDVLAALDRLEGHPSFYTRRSIVLAGWQRAETYFFRARPTDRRTVIEAGCWRSWNVSREPPFDR